MEIGVESLDCGSVNFFWSVRFVLAVGKRVPRNVWTLGWVDYWLRIVPMSAVMASENIQLNVDIIIEVRLCVS
jgi:hypothetical protein